MLDNIRNSLSSLDYANDYFALWISASIVFLGIALGPALIYLIFFSEIDKSVKTAMRGPSVRDLEPEEIEERSRSGRRRRRKGVISRRMLLIHAPALLGLLALGFGVAFGLTRLLSSI